MRFFTALSVAFAAVAGVAAQSATGSANPAIETGTMGGNAITAPIATDTITAGETYDIAWTNTVGSTVTLVLMDGPTNQLTPVATIVANIDNTGSYSWKVPESLPASSTYAIRISYDSNPNNYNYSDRFTFDSDATATPTVSTASSTTTEASTSTETSTETETSTSTTESETETTSAPVSTSTSTSLRTTTSRRTTTSGGSEPTNTGGAPPSAANAHLSSPIAVIMAVLAAALFMH